MAFLGASLWQYMWPNGLVFETPASAQMVRELGVEPAADDRTALSGQQRLE
jgi:hypothetical protein